MRMEINGRLLDAIKVYDSNCKNKKYLNWLKESLRQKHHNLLLQLQKEPRFYLNVASSLQKTDAME